MTRREILEFLWLASMFPVLPKIVAMDRASANGEEPIQDWSMSPTSINNGHVRYYAEYEQLRPEAWETREQVIKEMELCEP